MTDTTLSVKLDDLNGLVTKLGTVSSHLSEATGHMKSLSSDEAGDIHGSIDDFADHWNYGVGQIKKSIDSLHDTLANTSSKYTENETKTAAALHPGGAQ